MAEEKTLFFIDVLPRQVICLPFSLSNADSQLVYSFGAVVSFPLKSCAFTTNCSKLPGQPHPFTTKTSHFKSLNVLQIWQMHKSVKYANFPNSAVG